MLLLQVTYYEFNKEEVDAAMEGHKKHQRTLTHVPSRVENKEAFNILMVNMQLLSIRLPWLLIDIPNAVHIFCQ